MASDNDFFVIRRFGTIHAQVILAMQDRISEEEELLEALDKTYSTSESEDVNNGSFREEPIQNRIEILSQLKPMLLEYGNIKLRVVYCGGDVNFILDQLVLALSQLRARPGAEL